MGATVIRKIINNPVPGLEQISMSYFYNFFVNIDCSIMSVSMSNNIVTVSIDNLVQLVINGSTGRIYIIDNSGTPKGDCTLNRFMSTYTCTCCYSDTFFYFQYNDNYSRRFLSVYEVSEGKHYFGEIDGSNSTGIAWYPISSVSLKQIEDQSYYSHIQMLSYTAPLNYIDYSLDMLFENGNTMSNYVDTNTVTCTTITPDNVITFGSHNYYSLGPNTLIQLNSN